MAKKSVEQLEKENNELRKKIAELESLLNEKDEDEGNDIEEIENPYTVTNRAIDELVSPKDTMFYLTGNQIPIVLTAHEFARLPEYFGEKPVTELSEYAEKLKRHLVSKNGRGRRDILKVLRVSSGESRENVNKNLISRILKGDEKEDED